MPFELPQVDPLIVSTPSRGDITIAVLSINKAIDLEKLRAKANPSGFLHHALAALIIAPSISARTLESWDATDLRSVAAAWASWQHGLDRPLDDGDLGLAFVTAFDSYLADLRATTRHTLAPVVDSLRRSHQDMERMIRPFQDAAFYSDALRVRLYPWHEELARSIALTEDLGVKQMAMLDSVRTNARLITDLTAAVGSNPGLESLTAGLTDLSLVLRDSAGHQALIRAIAQTHSVVSYSAARLLSGLDSLSASASSVIEEWSVGIQPPPNARPYLLRGPVVEVAVASTAAAAVLGGHIEGSHLTGNVAELEEFLRSELNRLRPELVAVYAGAKRAVARVGPDQGRHLAVSLRELFTHILHILAPDDQLRQWSEATPDDYSNGRPTRRFRVRYVFRHLSTTSYGVFVADDIKRTIELIEVLNAETHSLDSKATPLALRLTLRRAEGVLALLLDAARPI